MSFLFPNILWGLFGLTIPIIIHLYNLRKSKTLEFSSIQHIQALEKNSIKRLKILQWILILLRMGIIASLILMFSGPLIISETIWIPSKKESTAVIIIDNSASMSVKNDNLTFLDQAKEKIPKILSSFDGLVNLKVIQTNPPLELYSGTVEEGSNLDYKDWKVDHSNGKDNLWNLVDSLLSTLDMSLPNKEFFILSDFQFEPPRSLKNKIKDWRFYALSSSSLNENIAITDISLMDQVKMPNDLLKLNTKIENMGKNEIRNLPVELYLNKERVGQIVSNFKINTIKDFSFQVYPGKSGVVSGKIEIPVDNFSLDNKQTFEINIPDQISCKVIASSDNGLFIIKTILESISGEEEFLDLELKLMSEIERIYLDETDVLILEDPLIIEPSAIESIKRFLNEGGSILWFAGENYKNINEQITSNLLLPNYEDQIILNDKSYLTVKVVDRKNPLLQDFNIRNLESSLPKIFRYNSIIPKKDHSLILNLNNNDPFLLNIPIYGSEIYFFTSPLDLKWNDFTMKGLLIPLIHRLLILSATNELNTQLIEVNEPKIISLTKELINKKWSIKLPSGRKILVIPEYSNEVIVFEETTELGSYEVFADDIFYTAFSTRLSNKESPKNRASYDKINSVIGNNNLVWIEDEMEIQDTIESQRHGILLWRLFLIIAIILFLLESYLSKPNPNSLKS
ncbi:MAG: BatA domain-containing protein [Candidatus Neomarinimicrobiota bacterium]